MILPAVLVLVILSVPLLGGDLRRTAEVRLRGTSFVVVSLAGQLLLINVYGHLLAPRTAGLVHVATYVCAGVAVVLNRRLPGLVLIALGGGLNLLAIAANGGVMPASHDAIVRAGMNPDGVGFANSAPLEAPRLAMFGDIWAVPTGWPFANVFSIGDVLLVVGAACLLHVVCRSTRVPSLPRATAEVLAIRPFRLLWLAQGISGLGDWAYAVVVAVALSTPEASTVVPLATVLAAQAGAGMIGGLLGASLLDRWPRRMVLMAADGMRMLGIASLVVAPAPSTVHFCVVAVIIGLGGAVHAPVLSASLPNLVPRSRLVDANALVNLSFQAAVVAGPVIGGLLIAGLGFQWAVFFNGMTFLVSLLLVARVALPMQAPAAAGHVVRSVREGIQHLAAARVTRVIMMISGLAVFASAVRAPVQPDFVLGVLGGTASTLGVVSAAWGAGMVLGTATAPALSRRWQPRQVLTGGVAVVGLAIALTGLQAALIPVLFLAVFGGAGNAIAVVIYETVLQDSTPDHVRGRVLAACEALDGLGFLLGAGTVALVATVLGPRGVYLLSGAIFLVVALVAHRSMRDGETADVTAESPQPSHVAGPADPADPADTVLAADSPMADAPTGVVLLASNPLRARRLLEALADHDPLDRAATVEDIVFAAAVLPAPSMVLVDAQDARSGAELRGALQGGPWADVPVRPVTAVLEAGTPAPAAAPYSVSMKS